MNLTKGQQDVMEADGHILVTGGPGSGKTTISILKAAQIANQNLLAGQRVLFLSFARATVSRVVEAIEHEQKIHTEQKKRIEVETYHSFFWHILKTHGYLIGLPRRLTFLVPSDEAVALSSIRSGFPTSKPTDVQKKAKKAAEESERKRLASEEGRVCFDLYAPFAGDLLCGSSRIRRLVAAMYPVIILDEFQDTNNAQWRVVQALGEFCRLIALADPEQRIYGWLGADPARLDNLREAFKISEFNLSADNHRSTGTEIALFGNDVLTGKFPQGTYKGVTVDFFAPILNFAKSKLKTTIYTARDRLIDAKINDWSLAILVPTKKMTNFVSDTLRQPLGRMVAIPHSAIIDMDAAILGAEVIALLMQPDDDANRFAQFINLLCNFFRGKGGDEPKKGALKEAADIRKAYEEEFAPQAIGKAIHKKGILVNMKTVYEQASALQLIGDPNKDWLAVRNVLENGACIRLKEIAKEARNLRILERGAQLRQALSQDWRDNGGYHNALSITRQAFVQEHFSKNSKPESGVIVMNMHKAKGKQFDEVIIFEGWPIKRKGQPPYNPDRIVWFNSIENIDINEARQNFRVSITRSKRQTTILTPTTDPCVLLNNFNR